jgi:DNA-binding LacI/PurR family transcriptional regulator
MAHVLELGHGRIGVITDRLSPYARPGFRSWDDVETSREHYLRERLAGYRESIDDHGGMRRVEVAIVEAENIDMSAGGAAADQLVRDFAPTAIVATSDVHAVAALKVLRARRITVPGEVSVIGFDDAPIADLMDLTTVSQPLQEKGRAAATMLLDLIAGRARRRSIKPTELLVRSTTGPPQPWEIPPTGQGRRDI